MGSRGIIRAEFTRMHWKAWVVISLIGAGLGDGLISSAAALCRPESAEAACCCGPQCEGRSDSAAGLRAACCDMQRAPRRDADTSPAPRDVAPPAPFTAPVISVTIATADIPHRDDVVALDLPESLHAPPLYELFRSYRI